MRGCRACASDAVAAGFTAREMMFGTRDRFDYVECAACGSVQIDDIPPPEVLRRYYPASYYAFEDPRETGRVRMRLAVDALRARHALERRSLRGALLDRLRPLPTILEVFRQAGVRRSSRILDVGCGRGALLDYLAGIGFGALAGVDPFVERDFATRAGVPVAKAVLQDVSGSFDAVMFHHSLEHVPDPVAALAAAHKRLHPGGACLVHVPTTTSEAWRRYRENWVQLDAPRHLLVPSRAGMRIMAERSGFALERTIDDSSGFQFWGSELYRRGIPLHGTGRAAAPFTRGELAGYARRAKALNAQGLGDQAAFVLRKRP